MTTNVEITTATEKFDDLEACVLDGQRGRIFPPPRGGIIRYSYPFVFSARGD
jgi:hypothetical protein